MNIVKASINRGQSLVELALLLPSVLLLAVITLDLGRGIYYYSAIYNAAREGARYGIVHQQPYNPTPVDRGGIITAAREKVIGLNQDDLDVPTIEINGDMLTVEVTYKFELVTPLAKFFLPSGGNHLHLSSTSTMLIER